MGDHFKPSRGGWERSSSLSGLWERNAFHHLWPAFRLAGKKVALCKGDDIRPREEPHHKKGISGLDDVSVLLFSIIWRQFAEGDGHMDFNVIYAPSPNSGPHWNMPTFIHSWPNLEKLWRLYLSCILIYVTMIPSFFWERRGKGWISMMASYFWLGCSITPRFPVCNGCETILWGLPAVFDFWRENQPPCWREWCL